MDFEAGEDATQAVGAGALDRDAVDMITAALEHGEIDEVEAQAHYDAFRAKLGLPVGVAFLAPVRAERVLTAQAPELAQPTPERLEPTPIATAPSVAALPPLWARWPWANVAVGTALVVLLVASLGGSSTDQTAASKSTTNGLPILSPTKVAGAAQPHLGEVALVPAVARALGYSAKSRDFSVSVNSHLVRVEWTVASTPTASLTKDAARLQALAVLKVVKADLPTYSVVELVGRSGTASKSAAKVLFEVAYSRKKIQSLDLENLSYRGIFELADVTTPLVDPTLRY